MNIKSIIILFGTLVSLAIPITLIYSYLYVDNLDDLVKIIINYYPDSRKGTPQSITDLIFLLFGFFGPLLIIIHYLTKLWFRLEPKIINKFKLQ